MIHVRIAKNVESGTLEKRGRGEFLNVVCRRVDTQIEKEALALIFGGEKFPPIVCLMQTL